MSKKSKRIVQIILLLAIIGLVVKLASQLNHVHSDHMENHIHKTECNCSH